MKHLDLQLLRQKHPTFYFRKVEYQYKENGVEVSFLFELENGPVFTPHYFFPDVLKNRFSTLDSHLVQEWCFQIGLVEMLSYWKTACSPKIMIQAGYLNRTQISFWQTLLEKGLSEFFFVNQIDGWENGFVTIVVDHPQAENLSKHYSLSEQVLIPVGGGKDSAVTLELSKEVEIPASTISINTNDQVAQVLSTAGKLPHYNVVRALDSQLQKLNAEGYLNGHTPFSALLGFVTTFAALLYDFKYVALSNEWSANEGNTVFLGQQINHQYSKSFEFEAAFSEYLHTYLSPEMNYFSWLRPLHEIQIAYLFSQYPKYFSVFLSCNRGQKTGKWCGECPKCLFVFILLSAFLSPEEVQKIWGKDLFQNLDLKPILLELTGKVEVKSLECVGTRQESIYALALALHTYSITESHSLWAEARAIVGNIDQVADDAIRFLQSFQDDSLIPEPFKSLIKKKVKEMYD